jgi:transcriptional regulator with XRE-family HTH domain
MKQTKTRVPLTPSVLKWAREQKKWSVRAAAKDSGIATSKLSAFESGKDKPTVEELERIAKAYERPTAFFLLPEPPKDERYAFDDDDMIEQGWVPHQTVGVDSGLLTIIDPFYIADYPADVGEYYGRSHGVENAVIGEEGKKAWARVYLRFDGDEVAEARIVFKWDEE